MRRGWAAPAAALALFVVLAGLMFASTWRHPGAAWIGSDRDPHLFMWYLGWVPSQVVSGHSPFFTTYLDYPGGANLMWNTSIFVPAMLLWPVTAELGPVISYNVLVTAAVALSAWCAYLAVRRLVGSDLFAAAAGLLYGFSPYMVGQSVGHPHVTLVMFPPLVLMLLHEVLVVRRRSPLLMGGLLGVASAVQLLTAEETLATTALFAAGGIALLCLLHPREVAARAPRGLAALAAAVVSFGVLAAYPIAFQFLGPQRAFGILQHPNTYVSDLSAFVVPPGAMQLTTRGSTALTGGFTGNAVENDATYVGVPLILLFSVWAVLRWRRPTVRWAALMTVGVAVLSLGPRLHVGGRVTRVPLPWELIGKLPLMQNVLPSRLMLFAFLGIGIVVADAGAAAVRAGPRQTTLAVGALAVALLPLFPRLPYPSTGAQAPTFFTAWRGQAGHLSPGSVVLVTPYANNDTSVAMYWQATANYRFRMPEGEAFVPPGPSLAPPPSYLQTTLDALEDGTPVQTSVAGRSQALHELSAFGVSTVVAGPSPGQSRIVEYFTALLGRPPDQSGGVAVWWNVEAPDHSAGTNRVP